MGNLALREGAKLRGACAGAVIFGLVAGLTMVGPAMLGNAAHAQANAAVGRESGLPVPRFLSLKADKVNVRAGPSRDQAVAWVFTRAGLPVEVTAEFETWRRIRDSDGTEGWVYHSMLSNRRTALVGPWLKDGPTSLYSERSDNSRVAAQAEAGVLGQIKDCDGNWCRFYGDGFEGFIQQEKLWGVYPGEKVD